MSTNHGRLTADHNEVVQTLARYHNISLISTSGEPVDEYEIEFRLKGFTIDPDEKITTGKRHRIKIKIPFGYPHFPPIVHPLSPIFHPEIDNHVVPIADYWQEKKSLPDLILHIGNMICGNFRSREMPINKDAADFYEKNASSLPLDSLKTVKEKEPQIKREPRQFRIPVPLLYLSSLCLILMLSGTGGLFLFEKWRLNQAAEVFGKAVSHHNGREFQKAQKTAEEAREKLTRSYLLRNSGNILREEISSFLHSESLAEGLKGNIRYGDKFISMEQAQQIEFLREQVAEAEIFAERRELEAAAEAYGKAAEYADRHDLRAEKERFLPDYSEIQLEVLVDASARAHAGKNRERAIEQHVNVLDHIEKYGKYLEGEEKQKAKTQYLLLIDQIALYSREATEAEKRKEFGTSLEYHNMIINLIGQADSADNIIFKNTLSDSLQRATYLTEKMNIEERREWLLNNYKEIFQLHNPSVIVSGLRSPQAIFVKYDDEKPVFDLSCLEKGTGSVVRLRIFYQYNPGTKGWSLYSGDIESF